LTQVKISVTKRSIACNLFMFDFPVSAKLQLKSTFVLL